jgi:NAD(P)H dehydrogenase (quinone)
MMSASRWIGACRDQVMIGSLAGRVEDARGRAMESIGRSSMTVLVTGASGHLGRLAVQSLLARGATDVVGGARSPERVEDLGVPVRELDYDRPETIATALAGVESLLLVSASVPGGRVAQHRAVIDAAAAAGVQHLVYTSAPRATTTDLLVAPEHRATEELIAAGGIPATILRNNWYTENYAGTLEQAAATGTVLSSAGEGRVASASRIDYADAAAVVLLDAAAHAGRTYELSGDVAWTFADLAAALTEVLGRTVTLQPLTPDAHRAALLAAGLDEGTVGFLLAMDASIAAGALDKVDDSLSTLIGRPATPLVEGLRALR